MDTLVQAEQQLPTSRFTTTAHSKEVEWLGGGAPESLTRSEQEYENAKALYKMHSSWPDARLLMTGWRHLPSRETMSELIPMFLHGIDGIFPHLFDHGQFIQDFGCGNVPPVLLLAICSLSWSLFSPNRSSPRYHNAVGRHAAISLEIALTQYETPCVPIIQTYLLLSLQFHSYDEHNRGMMLSGMALRMASYLKLDPQSELYTFADNYEQADWSRHAKLRRDFGIWETCVHMERFSSFLLGSPRSATDTVFSSLSSRGILFGEEVSIDEPVGQDPLFRAQECAKPPIASGPFDDLSGPASYLLGHVGQLMEIWDVTVSLYHHQVDVSLDDALNSKLQRHRAQEALKSWSKRLPSELQWHGGLVLSKATGAFLPRLLMMHCLYFTIDIFLQSLTARDRPRQPPIDSMKAFATAAEYCVLRSAVQIAWLIHARWPAVQALPVFGYSALYAADILAHATVEEQPEIAAIARERLGWCMQFLEHAKKRWLPFRTRVAKLRTHYTLLTLDSRGLDDRLEYKQPCPFLITCITTPLL